MKKVAHWSQMQKDKVEPSTNYILSWKTVCVWMILYVSYLYYFLVKAGGECNERRKGQCGPQRSPAEAAVPLWRQPQSCDLGKVNKRWPTAGLQENRVQTRSNTLLLRAAEATGRSQSAHESTVDFFPWNLSRQQGANPTFWICFHNL